MSVRVFVSAIFFLFWASQLYWLLRIRAWGRRRIPSESARTRLALAGLAIYLAALAYNFRWFGGRPSPTRLTLTEAILGAPFQWWVFGSGLAFLILGLFWLARHVARAAARSSQWLLRSLRQDAADPPALPQRRQFLHQTATAVAAVPFVAGAYGLFYGRLNLKTTQRLILLPRLPRAFHGFRIAQLSDLHIGPFMSESEIRRYVQITNDFKPDLTVLTGDFVTWDPSTQQAVVRAVAGLRAPFGIYGCLGNHEAWTHTEDSITFLLEQVGIRILRRACAPVAAHGEAIHLIGVDFETRRAMRRRASASENVVRRYLEGVEALIAPDAVNILLSHNPNTFDRAAELGIDLSLAGHTHGGQIALEFVSPDISPSRLITPYVAGWFQKPGGQLYVNRGIGTIGVPIRLGAPPEISVFELVRPA